MIKAVLFDVIGTTVREKDPNTITACFEKAFRDHGLLLDGALVKANRGRDKKEMIETLLDELGQSRELAAGIYHAFKRNVEHRLDNFEAQEGASAIFEHLRENKIKVGLGTGLSRDLFETIIAHLRWPIAQFDYIGSPDSHVRGRPHPDMIQDMMRRLVLTDPRAFLKVGDTVADIREGRNAGVTTVAILAGTQSKEQLKAEKPDHIITKLVQLRKLIA